MEGGGVCGDTMGKFSREITMPSVYDSSIARDHLINNKASQLRNPLTSRTTSNPKSSERLRRPLCGVVVSITYPTITMLHNHPGFSESVRLPRISSSPIRQQHQGGESCEGLHVGASPALPSCILCSTYRLKHSCS